MLTDWSSSFWYEDNKQTESITNSTSKHRFRWRWETPLDASYYWTWPSADWIGLPSSVGNFQPSKSIPMPNLWPPWLKFLPSMWEESVKVTPAIHSQQLTIQHNLKMSVRQLYVVIITTNIKNNFTDTSETAFTEMNKTITRSHV